MDLRGEVEAVLALAPGLARPVAARIASGAVPRDRVLEALAAASDANPVDGKHPGAELDDRAESKADMKRRVKAAKP